MNNRHHLHHAGYAIWLAILFLPVSCLEYTVHTTVSRDGSIVREYTVRGDSSDIFKGSLMIPAESPWKITRKYETGDRKKETYCYTASRKFRDISELRKWLQSDTASGTVKIEVNLKKHFRWFYTYYEFTERYPMSFPFKGIPVDSFMTETEQSFLAEDGRTVYSPVEKKWIWKQDTIKFKYNHTDSLEINRMDDHCSRKLAIWMTSAIIYDFADIVESNFKKDPAFSGIKNALLHEAEFIAEKAVNSSDSVLTKKLVQMVDSLTKSKKLSGLYLSNPLIFRHFNANLKIMDHRDYSDDFECSLRMPGQVYSTNAFRRDPMQLKWKFGPMQFFMKDFKMSAESRTSNPWIMILTGIVAIMMILILAVRRKK
jgi:hypothetical protein